LRGLNLKLKHGEIVSVVGPSGSGKSTLLRTLGGLQEPSAGNVFYDGLNLQKVPEEKRVPFRRNTVGYVFQEGNLIPTVSAFNNIVQTMKFAGASRSDARRRTRELMKLLGMEDRMHSLPTHLSGGERQRVAIARALANDPLVLLMDEPTGNLDYKNAENVMEMIVKLRDEIGTSCLIVTHSKHIASFTDRSLELRDGRFIGQHGGDLKLESLEKSRQVFIAPDGTLTLPPEMRNLIETHGELWDMRVENDKGENPRIILEVSVRKEHSGPMHGGICPVCKNEVKEEEFFCNSCGAKLT
jgi:ABC-type lipoprotein export system ATPase subunit